MKEATTTESELTVDTAEFGRLPTWELVRREKERSLNVGIKRGRTDVLEILRKKAKSLALVSIGHDRQGYIAVLNAIEKILAAEMEE